MQYQDPQKGIAVDSEFECGSAGVVSKLADGTYQIDFQPEEVPTWFQQTLDDLFKGAGVPKEYMFYVRLSNKGSTAQRIKLRFLFSRRGERYLDLPWWIRRDNGWTWIDTADTHVHAEEGINRHLDARVSLEAGETVFIASAPYESPGTVASRCEPFVDFYGGWTCTEIGRTAKERPLLVLESEPRPLRISVEATMQSSEPVSSGILHVAHWLTIPTARSRGLFDRIQFCLLPLTNPDGVAAGHSVTNARGEIPKFSFHQAAEDKSAPRETQALWDYLSEVRPDASIEVHAHFTRLDFSRSIGMQDKASMPAEMREKAKVISEALDVNYGEPELNNRCILVDPRKPEENVYGYKEFCEKLGVIRTWIQAVPDTFESHAADVREMVEIVANALIRWEDES